MIAAIVGLDTRFTIAEKVETILRRGVFPTRPKDYYDVYILGRTQKYDKAHHKSRTAFFELAWQKK